MSVKHARFMSSKRASGERKKGRNKFSSKNLKNFPNSIMIVTLNPTKPYSPKFYPQCPHLRPAFDFCGAKVSLSLTTTCKLKTSHDGRSKEKSKNNSSSNVTKKILLSESAPPVREETGGEVSGDGFVKEGGEGGGLRMVKRFPRRILAVLSNLPLAITEMFTIAALMALGTLWL